MTAFQRIRTWALAIAGVVISAGAAGYAGDLQAAPQKKVKSIAQSGSGQNLSGHNGLGQMRYYGGPKSPMWRG